MSAMSQQLQSDLCVAAAQDQPQHRPLLPKLDILAVCRRRTGTERNIFGDLITADHKVVSGESESRYNHRYAVMVQDLATQWIQSYPCKTKTSQETRRSLQKFLDPNREAQSHLHSQFP